MSERSGAAAGSRLSATHGSLAYGVPPSRPSTLYALSVGGGITVGPKDGRKVLFGRNRPDVHVCVGEDDRGVSRCHGELRHQTGYWWLTNLGKLPIRLPGTRLLFKDEEAVPLEEGYTPLFVRGGSNREHLLEVYVTGPDGKLPTSRHRDVTQPPRIWRLTDSERLALVALGQRYLLHEARPQPLSWKQAYALLDCADPDAGWTPRKVEHTVEDVRKRLSRGGVPGLTREEVGEPVGNALNDNLLREMLLSTTLVPPDLALLDPPKPAAGPLP